MPDRRVRFGYGTARAWKGNIGRLVFIIDCADVGGTDSVFVRRAFPKDSRREFRTENLIIMEERDSEPAGAAHLFLAANHYDHQIGYQLMCQEENYDARHGCLVPWGKPVQIWSRVNRDSKLTDSFFESDEWSYPWYIIKHGEGHFEDIGCANQPPRKEPPHLKHTAKCVSTSFGEDHAVHFCEAKLLDVNMIDLFINEYSSVFRDALRVRIINGMFTCQYWIPEIGPLGFYEYTTKRQKLTLDKKAYRKGDVIKGRIDFECVQEPSDPRIRGSWPRAPKTIKLSGVFKTIVE